jgi:hypothetical protein
MVLSRQRVKKVTMSLCLTKHWPVVGTDYGVVTPEVKVKKVNLSLFLNN